MKLLVGKKVGDIKYCQLGFGPLLYAETSEYLLKRLCVVCADGWDILWLCESDVVEICR